MYVEKKGPAKQWTIGGGHGKSALIIYDPDPFYNIDEQVCLAFGKALSNENLKVTIATVAAAEALEGKNYSVLVYCATTYNWKPEWAITNFIKEHPVNSPVVAITLGAGSTEGAAPDIE